MTEQGRYFTFLNDGPVHVWNLKDRLVVRVGVPDPTRSDSAHVVLGLHESLDQGLARVFPAAWAGSNKPRVRDMILAPGQYYPRMARPSDQHPDDHGGNPGANLVNDELAVMRGQLVSLMHSLVGICQVVHPEEHTWQAYGHEIRNTLILACTEVEAHWRSVLIANGYRKDRFSTADYVLLHDAMKLSEYAISLPYYPWLPDIRPFATWNTTGRPTQDLSWYDAYNAVKHDRQGSFARATLESAINAVVACAILLIAQFGPSEAFRWRTEFGYFFRISAIPRWDRTEVYTYPYESWGAGLQPVPYPFAVP